MEYTGSVAWALVSLSMRQLLAGKFSTMISMRRSASSCKLQGSVHCMVAHNKVSAVYRYKAVADGPVGQVLAGPLFLQVKIKFNFTKSK